MPALGAAALLLTLSACSGASAGDEGGDCESHALMITNVTGAGSVNGTLGSAGAKVAVDYVNESGGVNGCTLVLDIKDDGSDYTKALPMLQEAMATQDYDIVIPADFGASAVLPALKRAEQFTIFVNGTVGLTSPEETPLMFDSAVPSAYQAAAFAQWMVEEKGVQKVAVAVDNTSIGEAVLASFTAALEEAGGEVVAAESADLASVNFTPLVQRLQGTGADSVFVNLFGTAGAYFVRDYQASGWGAPLYGGESVMGTGIDSTPSSASPGRRTRSDRRRPPSSRPGSKTTETPRCPTSPSRPRAPATAPPITPGCRRTRPRSSTPARS